MLRSVLRVSTKIATTIFDRKIIITADSFNATSQNSICNVSLMNYLTCDFFISPKNSEIKKIISILVSKTDFYYANCSPYGL